MLGLLGGAFDPPHDGHVALARAALERFPLERLVVLVVAAPGHKPVETPAEDRLALARIAFAGLPRTKVVQDGHAYTVDLLGDCPLLDGDDDTVFLVGADEFADFLAWRQPDEILRLVRLAVATRPGYPWERLEPVLARLERRDRVEFFPMPAVPASSTEIRGRLRRGEPVDGMVPGEVVRELRRRGLYGGV